MTSSSPLLGIDCIMSIYNNFSTDTIENINTNGSSNDSNDDDDVNTRTTCYDDDNNDGNDGHDANTHVNTYYDEEFERYMNDGNDNGGNDNGGNDNGGNDNDGNDNDGNDNDRNDNDGNDNDGNDDDNDDDKLSNGLISVSTLDDDINSDNHISFYSYHHYHHHHHRQGERFDSDGTFISLTKDTNDANTTDANKNTFASKTTYDEFIKMIKQQDQRHINIICQQVSSSSLSSASTSASASASASASLSSVVLLTNEEKHDNAKKMMEALIIQPIADNSYKV